MLLRHRENFYFWLGIDGERSAFKTFTRKFTKFVSRDGHIDWVRN